MFFDTKLKPQLFFKLNSSSTIRFHHRWIITGPTSTANTASDQTIAYR